MTKQLTPREKAINFFEGLNITNLSDAKQHPAYFYGESKSRASIQFAAAVCHANLQAPSQGWKTLGSGFIVVPRTQHLGELYWEWITGNESPWRDLLVNGIKPVYSKHTSYQTGWILPEETLKEADFRLLKNFCIATRPIYEKSEKLQVWKELIDKGLHPSEAFFLCSFFRKTHGNNNLTLDYVSAQGAHWPTTADKFNLFRFKSGKPNYFTDRWGINIIWKDKQELSDWHDLISIFQRSGKLIKTQFSSVTIYDLDEILDIYRKKRDEIIK